MKAINQEQLALYYSVGRYISVNTRKKNWGTGFIDAISEQLRKQMPGLKGFSAPSMRKMRTFYEEWKQLERPNSFVETNKLESAEDNSFVVTNKLPEVKFSIDADFLSKMSIAYKEADESDFWINLLHDNGYIDDRMFESLSHDLTRILKMLTSIVKTMNNKVKGKR